MPNPVTEGYRAARELRQRRGLGKQQRLDPFELASSLGIVVVRRPLAERRIAGAYLYRSREQRSFILINATDLMTRQRFTAAHELGHWSFERQETVVDDDLECGETHVERRANAFSAELLLPEAAVRAWSVREGWPQSTDEIAELAISYGLSYDATMWRLVNCRVVENGSRFRDSSSVSADRRAQLNLRGEEETTYPPEFLRWTDQALETNLISPARFRELRSGAPAEMRF